MEKIKIKDLALEISVDIKDIISKCKDLSIVARSSSSSVASEDAEKIKSSFSNHKIDSTKSENLDFRICRASSLLSDKNRSYGYADRL